MTVKFTPTWGRKAFRFLAPVLVLALGVAGFMGLHATKPEAEKKDDGPRPVSLFVEKAEAGNVTLLVRTQGEVRPRTEIDLVAQVPGRVASVAPNFVVGGGVKKGETLVRIEDTDYRFAVTSAEARVAAARTGVELAEASAEVARRNWDDSIVGEPTPLAMKLPQLEEARANLRAAEADLELARVNLARTRISVPFNGRVRVKSADIGQYVSPGIPLGRVYSTEVAEIRLPLTDAQLASLGLPIGYMADAGEGRTVTFHATVAGAERTWQGRIVRTEGALDASTRVLYAVAEVEEPYDAGADDGMPMAIGLFVTAEIEGDSLENVVSLPRSALRSGDTVYVVAEDGTLDIRTVEIRQSTPDRIVISAGVSAGEQVVVSPVRNPRNGMEVVALERQSSIQVASTDQPAEGK